MSITNYLVSPIRVECVHLPTRRMVSSPLADYATLPWTDGSFDYNFSNPFVGDSVVHHPFQNQNFVLDAGIHLHFIVPQFLGQQISPSLGTSRSGLLPAAPNRWLITKTNSAAGSDAGLSQWLVESDYLHPYNSAQAHSTACIIPFRDQTGTSPPFRVMGRTTALGAPRPAGETFKLLNDGQPLSVVGYGIPSFSSFYPNCFGVFGFCDGGATPSAGLEYSVLGWHADAEDDFLANSVQILTSGSSANDINSLNEQLTNFLRLKICLNGNQLPSGSQVRSLYYGTVTADAKSPLGAPDPAQLRISIGNTATEAISALVAEDLAAEAAPSGSVTGSTKGLKAQIEDQLESVLLHPKLSHLTVDVGPKFHEARHEKGFHSERCGHLWKVITKTEGGARQESGDEAGDLPSLPPTLATLLHSLNAAQLEYDRAFDRVQAYRESLYFDWYRYMRAAYPALGELGQYPDADHLRYHIESHSIPRLEREIQSTGELRYGSELQGFSPTAANSGASDLANAVVSAWTSVQTALVSENVARAAVGDNPLTQSLIPAARYWKPNAPAVLIAGLPPDTADTEETLAAASKFLPVLLLVSSQSPSPEELGTSNASDILSQCAALTAPTSATPNEAPAQDLFLVIPQFQQIANRKLSESAWNPFVLEWRIDLRSPDYCDSNGTFSSEALQSGFRLETYGPDLRRDPLTYAPGNLSVFTGSVLLSTTPRRSVLLQMHRFVEFALKNFTSKTDRAATVLESPSWSGAVDVLKSLGATDDSLFAADYASNPLFTVYMAYQKLLEDKVVAQTLSGFHEACLMRRRAAQLPIAEPLGFENAQRFTARVRALVQDSRDASPISAFGFNPLRAGKITNLAFRLVDNFGIATDVDSDSARVSVATPLVDSSSNPGVFLPPRFAQPARLNFRWLSAMNLSTEDGDPADSEDAVETNDHPLTSPVCGWIAANYLDNSLAFFAADGSAVGALNSDAVWQQEPWRNSASNLSLNIDNPSMRGIASWLSGSPTLLGDFLTATQVGLSNAAPTQAENYTSSAILMGRPMAIVRAKIGFQVKGKPARDLSWSSLLTELHSAESSTSENPANESEHRWTRTLIPFRLGEFHQLNDGLIGYWVEDAAGAIQGSMIAPQTMRSSIGTSDTQIVGFDGTNFPTQWISLEQGAVTVTMLVDARGLVHATSGVLPVKVLSIPPQYYLPAFKKIAMYFSACPLLQPVASSDGPLHLNLPAVQGYDWKWWDRYAGARPIVPDQLDDSIGGANALFDGFLILTPNAE